jgi:hypothetical protein
MSEPSDSLREQFGDIDVYLFDQLLRGVEPFGCREWDQHAWAEPARAG